MRSLSADSSARPLGNHNRCWVWGRNVVRETLRAKVWFPLEIRLSPRCPEELRREIHGHASQLNLPVTEVTDTDLGKCCRAEDHQGVALRLPEFPYVEFSDLQRQPQPPTRWLVLDGIQDSFNFGAMIRSAVELGTDALLIGESGQVGINSQVARSSAGAINYVPVSRVPSLATALQQLRSGGTRVIAASEKAEMALPEVDFRGSTAIVVGNEGHGVSAAVLEQCDVQVRIPSTHRVGSLNAAVAAGIVCYERQRQQPSSEKKSS